MPAAVAMASISTNVHVPQVPQLAASLGGLHQVLESRVSTFSRLCHLQGKLDLMLAQGQVTDGGISAAELALTTPMVTFTLQGNMGIF